MNTPAAATGPPTPHTHRKPGKPVTDGPRLPRLDAKHRGEPAPLLDQLRDVTRTTGRTHI